MAAKLRGYYWDEKQGVYAYDFRIRGHRFRGSLETADRRKAERNLKDKRDEAKVAVSQFTGSEPMTFGVASTRWFNEMASDRTRPDEPARYLRWLQPRVGKSTMIKDIDYACRAAVVSASAADAPHRRDRIWFVAHTERDEQSRQEPCFGPDRRVGREQQLFPWEAGWQRALTRFRALDHGLPRRVAATDAARNAIVPQVAAEVIGAFLDVEGRAA